MRRYGLLAIIAGSASAFASGLSQDDARAFAERKAAEGGVKLSEFALTEARKEPSGEWSFLYECIPQRPACHFVAYVNSNTGRVTITFEREERHGKQASSRTEAALASKTKNECEANRGTWLIAGMPNREFCDIAAPDAGKTCTDGSQCESACVVEGELAPGKRVTGRCSQWHHRLGRCVTTVKAGVTDGGHCGD